MESKFSNIYEKNIWGGGSGSGSKLSYDNKAYLKSIDDIIKNHNIHSILDIGCGDWEIMKHLSFDGDYLGLDIVKSVIDKNKINYPNKNFKHKDILDGLDTHYDLIIIKDVIQHHTNENILKIMKIILEKGKLIYCVNGFKFGRSPEKNNWTKRDIDNRYSYHPVDITKEPLNQYQHLVIQSFQRRCKEYLLIQNPKFET
jgi:SAM-dependent methyltransferase